MISKLSLDFLSRLKANNNREWFDTNKKDYEQARKEFLQFVQELIFLLGKWNPAYKGVESKDCVFRIYRDVRFSKNKQPYKNNFAASLSPNGRKSGLPGFYIHIEPSESFIAAGLYQPMPDQLAAIRQEIDYNLEEFEGILNKTDFKKSFKGLLEEDKLKTSPKGYAKDHPALEYLKNRHFIALHNIRDEKVLSKDFLLDCDKLCKTAQPLNAFLQRALD